MRKKKLFGLVLGLVFSMLIFSGCGSSNSNVAQMFGEAAEIKIAILGSEEQFAKREDFLIGMDLAIRELEAQNIKVTYEKIDDGNSRDSGIAQAKDVANNDAYTIAFTLQTSDVVESITAIFEEAKKPLLIINEVFDSTMNKGYEYILAGVISAENKGKALAKYCESNGIKWVSAAHSGTPYETMLARGFNDAAMDSASTYLLDSTSGPDNASEFAYMYDRWETLGVEAALVSFDDIEWACEIIANLKARNSDLLILGDVQFGAARLLDSDISVLDGLVIAGAPVIDDEETLQAFYSKFVTSVAAEASTYLNSVSARAFDFVHMVAQNVRNSSDAQEFMAAMKSADGYVGVTRIRFNSNGQLDEQGSYAVVNNGHTYRLV